MNCVLWKGRSVVFRENLDFVWNTKKMMRNQEGRSVSTYDTRPFIFKRVVKGPNYLQSGDKHAGKHCSTRARLRLKTGSVYLFVCVSYVCLYCTVCVLPSGSSFGDCTSGSAKDDELAVEDTEIRSPKDNKERSFK